MARKKAGLRQVAFVLDCSVTVAWFFEDEASSYAESVEDSLVAVAAVVPALWHLEVANAVLVGERRGRTTEAKAGVFLTLLTALPISSDDETQRRAWHETMNLARAHRLSLYDAAYLELAMRRGLPLATLDDKLKRTAAVIGVTEFAP